MSQININKSYRTARGNHVKFLEEGEMFGRNVICGHELMEGDYNPLHYWDRVTGVNMEPALSPDVDLIEVKQ